MSSPQEASLELASVFEQLGDASSIQLFLNDLCSPAELLAMAERWHIVSLLQTGASYREIAAQAKISVTTVGRVARSIRYGSGGYALALKSIS